MRSVALALVACATMAVSITAASEDRQWPDARSSAAALRARGIALGYNLDYPEALAAFRGAIAADPDHPAAYRLAAATAWITMLFAQGAITVEDYLGQARADVTRVPADAAIDAGFRADITRALSLAEERLRRQPTDPDARYQVGAAFGVLASYTATVEGRVFGSLGPARRAYQEHERVLKADPLRKDAGLIVGTYRYAVSELSPPQRLIARLAGLGGGRERGLRMVEEAARHPGDSQPNALFTLLLLYNREARYDEALDVIATLRHLFPRNRLLWLETGNAALRAGRPAEARTALEEGLTRLAADRRLRANGEEARWHLAYGASLAALREVTLAERELQAALAGANRDWVRGRAHAELGTLADLAGDRPRAIAEYRLAEQLCRADRDGLCTERARQWMRTAHRP